MPVSTSRSHLAGLAVVAAFAAVASAPSSPASAGGAVTLGDQGIQVATPAPAPSPGLDLARARVVDLSHAYGPDTLYWPSAPPSGFALQELHKGATPGGFFYASNAFCTPEHGGTHLDAPIHFGEGKWTADEIPADRLVGPAVVLDATAQAAADRDYRLTRADVVAWEARHGKVPAGAIVLLRTGWSDRWPNRERYFGSASREDASGLHFPSFGADAAELLIERGVVALGVDTASIDHGPSTDFMVHRVTAAANVFGLENLTGLGELPPVGAWVVALPMKIAGGSGGPLRAIALLPE
jgi:kynurenine formamidase